MDGLASCSDSILVAQIILPPSVHHLSDRVYNVLEDGHPPSRGHSSIGRLAPAAVVTAPPRRPPREFRRNRGEKGVHGQFTSTSTAVLAPPNDELLAIADTMNFEAPVMEKEPEAHRKRCISLHDYSPIDGYILMNRTVECRASSSAAAARVMIGGAREWHDVSAPTLVASAVSSGATSTGVSDGNRSSNSGRGDVSGGSTMQRQRRSSGGSSGLTLPARHPSLSSRNVLLRGEGLPRLHADAETEWRVSHHLESETEGRKTVVHGGNDGSARGMMAPSPLPSQQSEGDTTKILVVAKGESGSKGGSRRCNRHPVRRAGNVNKLACGPLIVRFSVPSSALDKATVHDIKKGLERQVGVPLVCQTLLASGVVLLDDMPLSLLDPTTVLFMEARRQEADDEDEKEEDLEPLTKRTPVQLDDKPLPPSCSRGGLLERLEKMMHLQLGRYGHVISPTTTAAEDAERGTNVREPAMTRVESGVMSSHTRSGSVNVERQTNCVPAAHVSAHVTTPLGPEKNDSASVRNAGVARMAGSGAFNCDGGTAAPLTQQQSVRSQFTCPMTGTSNFGSSSSGVEYRSGTCNGMAVAAQERPKMTQQEMLEDAMMKTRQQMELLAWLLRRSQCLPPHRSSNTNNKKDGSNENPGASRGAGE